MTQTRTPGPVCSIYGQGNPGRTNLSLTPPGASLSRPGPVRTQLTLEQEELALDVTQIVLDVIGIFEPTPFADGTNALISLGRKDWLGAGISALGIIPYIGDLAKAGKLGRYSETLWKAVALAKKDANFAKYLRPPLQKLKELLDTIPTRDLSPRVATMIDSIKRPLDSFLGRWSKYADDLDSVTDRLLSARGFAKNIAPMVRSNVKTVAQFLRSHGISEGRMLDVLSGIDLHSPVTVEVFKKGSIVTQYVDEASGVGSWFTRSGGGHGMADIGIAEGKRVLKRFRMTKDVPVLKSNSAAVVDTWTPNRVANSWKPDSRIVIDKAGKIDITSGTAKISPSARKGTYGAEIRGGGTQFYMPSMRKSQGDWIFDNRQWMNVMEDYVLPKKN